MPNRAGRVELPVGALHVERRTVRKRCVNVPLVTVVMKTLDNATFEFQLSPELAAKTGLELLGAKEANS